METLKIIKKIDELRGLNKSLTQKLSEKAVENIELKNKLKKAEEEIQKLMETANIWADEVVRNYHVNGGDLEKAQAVTGKTIIMHELSKGKENSNVSNI